MSSYRDDLEAAHARADALARENEKLRQEKEELEARAATPPPRSPAKPARRRLRVDVPTVEDDRPRWPLWRKIGLVVGIVSTIVMIGCGIADMGTADGEEQYTIWWLVAMVGTSLGFWVAAGMPAGSD